jgi:hypothetical protein
MSLGTHQGVWEMICGMDWGLLHGVDVGDIRGHG